MNLTNIQEEYLKTIYILEDALKEVRVTDIANKLNKSKSSVNYTIKNLKANGLIEYELYSDIKLTENGIKLVKDIIKKQDTLKDFFVEVLKIDSDIALKEASNIEHSISKEIVCKLEKYMGNESNQELSDGTYLDYAASTPTDKEVLDVFYNTALKYYSNPNSSHKLGREAKKLLDNSTNHIAELLNILPEEIIYTSGASESNNLVVKGICERYKSVGKHIIVSNLEHGSIITPATVMQEQGFEVSVLPVTKDGIVDLNELKKLIRDDTILVSVCSIDSELGIRQPIEKIANIVKEKENCFFHTDASQSIGKVNIDFNNVDLITIAPHKFYGMNGFGALIKKKHVSLKPIINGGKSTTVYRSGTPDLANVVALDKSLEIALTKMNERYNHVENLINFLRSELSKYKNVHINSLENSIPFILNFSLIGTKANILVKEFENQGIYVSAKTSCCPDSTPSKLVYAIYKDKVLATTSIRVSISHLTKQSDIIKFLDVFKSINEEVKVSEEVSRNRKNHN